MWKFTQTHVCIENTHSQIHTMEPYNLKLQLVWNQAIVVETKQLHLLKDVQVLEVGMCTGEWRDW